MEIRRYSYVAAMLLLCTSFTSFAQQLTIDEAVELWVLDGAKFESLRACSPVAKQSGLDLRLIIRPSNCVVTELAVYTLAKECQAASVTDIAILSSGDDHKIMSFAINNKTCALLSATNPLSASPTKIKEQQATQNQPYYVLQFYSGKIPPKQGISTCGIAVPLNVHHINNTYYLFSDVFERFSDASNVMRDLKKQCPDLAMWIRPIQR